jgi:hypothetical protein
MKVPHVHIRFVPARTEDPKVAAVLGACQFKICFDSCQPSPQQQGHHVLVAVLHSVVQRTVALHGQAKVGL